MLSTLVTRLQALGFPPGLEGGIRLHSLFAPEIFTLRSRQKGGMTGWRYPFILNERKPREVTGAAITRRS